MKKLLSLILSAVLIFSVFPSMNVEAANTNKEAGKAYADILQQYLTAEKLIEELGYDVWNHFENSGLEDVTPKFIGMYLGDTCDEVSYCIKDINNDGIPELFISEFEICTYYNGKAVHLERDLGERTNSTLCKNGIVEIWGHAAAYCERDFYKLPKNKGKLKIVCNLGYSLNGATNKMTYHYKINGKSKTISEEKYNNLLKKYRKPVKLTFYDADSKAVDNLRNGMVSYPGQKKIIVKDGFQ